MGYITWIIKHQNQGEEESTKVVVTQRKDLRITSVVGWSPISRQLSSISGSGI